MRKYPYSSSLFTRTKGSAIMFFRSNNEIIIEGILSTTSSLLVLLLLTVCLIKCPATAFDFAPAGKLKCMKRGVILHNIYSGRLWLRGFNKDRKEWDCTFMCSSLALFSALDFSLRLYLNTCRVDFMKRYRFFLLNVNRKKCRTVIATCVQK